MKGIRFEFLPDLDPNEEFDSFTMGHLIIHGESSSVSSISGGSRKLMMIVLSLMDLLYGVQNLISQENVHEFGFVGADSSFQFLIRKEQDKLLIRQHNGELISSMSPEEFVKCLWKSASPFVTRCLEEMDEDEVAYNDLLITRRKFLKEFDFLE